MNDEPESHQLPIISKEKLVALNKYIEKELGPDRDYVLIITDKPVPGRRIMNQFVHNGLGMPRAIKVAANFVFHAAQGNFRPTPGAN